MTGTLRERPFAEIVGSIFQAKQTGELTVTATGKAIAIHFQDGNPVAAASDDPSHRVARILLDNGKIGLGEAEMLGGLPESKQAFETVEYIAPDILLWGVKFRFLRLLEELFSWEDGEYHFTEGQVPSEALTLRVPTPFIIFTGTAKMPPAAFGSIDDEKSIAEVREIPKGQESFFNPQRKKFLAACKPGVKVGELLAEMPGDRERARHVLYALKALGLVTLAEPAAAEALEPPTPLFGDEGDPGPEADAPTAPPVAPEPLDTPAAEEPLSLFEDEEAPAAEPAMPPLDDGETELSLESPLDEEQEEVLLEDEDDAPLTLEAETEPEPELSPEEAAPELPLEMPPAGEIEPEMVLGEDEPPSFEKEAESTISADPDSFTLPTDETSPDVAAIDDGMPLSYGMGLDADREEAGILTAEPPEKPEEPEKSRRRLLPASRAGKIAAFGAVLLLVIGGSLLGLKTLGDKPVPQPETATAVAPVQPETAPVPPPEPEPEPAAVVATPPGGEADGEDPGATVPGAASSGVPDPAAAEPPSAATADRDRVPDGSDMSGAADPAGMETPTDEPPAETAAQEPAEVPAPPALTEDAGPVAPGSVPGGDPLEALQSGNVDGAARLWAEALRKKPQGSYTLQVLMACEAKSVQESYALFGGRAEAYTVPFSLKGRDCYRVGLGTYDSLAAAKTALDDLPAEIRRNGAVVKSLGQFLPRSLPPASPVLTESQPSQAPAEPVAEVPQAPVPEMPASEYEKAMDALQAGDLGGAAALWQGMLRQSPPGSYTLQILTACDGDTVKNYFSFFKEHGRVFAVPIRLQGRDCYRVGLETYPSKKAAAAALAAMPAWVRDQRTVVKSVKLFIK